MSQQRIAKVDEWIAKACALFERDRVNDENNWAQVRIRQEEEMRLEIGRFV